MILIDMSQILFAAASMSMKNGKADINIVRHMTLNSLKKYYLNLHLFFSNVSQEMVLTIYLKKYIIFHTCLHLNLRC